MVNKDMQALSSDFFIDDIGNISTIVTKFRKTSLRQSGEITFSSGKECQSVYHENQNFDEFDFLNNAYN